MSGKMAQLFSDKTWCVSLKKTIVKKTIAYAECGYDHPGVLKPNRNLKVCDFKIMILTQRLSL